MNIALRRFLHNHGNIATKGSAKLRLCPTLYQLGMLWHHAAVKTKKAVTAYFSSKQLLPFEYAWQPSTGTHFVVVMTSLWEILVTRYPRISDRLGVRRDDHPLILCTRVTVRVCSGDSKPQRDTEQTTPLWADSAQKQTDTLQPSNPRATIASETWRGGGMRVGDRSTTGG